VRPVSECPRVWWNRSIGINADREPGGSSVGALADAHVLSHGSTGRTFTALKRISWRLPKTSPSLPGGLASRGHAGRSGGAGVSGTEVKTSGQRHGAFWPPGTSRSCSPRQRRGRPRVDRPLARRQPRGHRLGAAPAAPGDRQPVREPDRGRGDRLGGGGGTGVAGQARPAAGPGGGSGSVPPWEDGASGESADVRLYLPNTQLNRVREASIGPTRVRRGGGHRPPAPRTS
jgi:hypothetical protein